MATNQFGQRIGRLVGRWRHGWSDSSSYWKDRYERHGNSGAGSYGRLAHFKADFLNGFVAEEKFASVLEIGCGDGNQLSLARYPEYVGVDVAPGAIALCRSRFADDPSKRFIVLGEEPIPTCELGLSLDVIYHLVEDAIFEQYMTDLVDHTSRCLVLYTSDADSFVPSRREPAHIRHRPVQAWMKQHHPEWELTRRAANPYPWRRWDQKDTSFADFYVYLRTA